MYDTDKMSASLDIELEQTTGPAYVANYLIVLRTSPLTAGMLAESVAGMLARLFVYSIKVAANVTDRAASALTRTCMRVVC